MPTRDESAREGFKGYCIHQPFGGMQIPIPGQNAVMRDYAARQRLIFKLSVNELNFPDCHVMLDSLTSHLDGLEGIIMTSLFILPRDDDARHRVLQRFVDEGRALHLVFENIVVREAADCDAVEQIIAVARTTVECPHNIPHDLLPPAAAFRSFTN
jgi:sporadic carbohydrate cluster protein (TIGR04323 family)